jgi:hypothetical protein
LIYKHEKKISELLGTQLNEDAMDEINQELEEIIKTSLPDVPSHNVEREAGEKTASPQKGFLNEFIFTKKLYDRQISIKIGRFGILKKEKKINNLAEKSKK